MCCEDIQVGRRTISVAHTIRTLATVYPVLPANPHRTAIIFLGSTSANNCVSINQPTAVTDGLRVSTTSNPFALTLAQHGDCVTKAWYGLAGVGGLMQVIETSLSGMCNDDPSDDIVVRRRS